MNAASPARILTQDMTRQVLRKALERKPFRRFSVRLTDGELVRIKSDHSAAVHPKGETMVIFEDDGSYRIVDIALITKLQAA